MSFYYACITFFLTFEFTHFDYEGKNHRLCIASHLDGGFKNV